jgi:hypothetical protein
MNIRFRKDFADEIHWPLHTKGMAFLRALHHDGRADDVSSHGDSSDSHLVMAFLRFSSSNGAVRIGGDWR